MVERWFVEPLLEGSIPSGSTIYERPTTCINIVMIAWANIKQLKDS